MVNVNLSAEALASLTADPGDPGAPAVAAGLANRHPQDATMWHFIDRGWSTEAAAKMAGAIREAAISYRREQKLGY